jgi:hypothetical protein
MGNVDTNLQQLEIIATALADLLPQVTFVGGCTTALLVDEVAHFGVRKTDDVDVIIDITTTAKYQAFSGELRKRGFREDTSGPICRWLVESAIGKVKLDVMPIDENILGFSNRWYKAAIGNSIKIPLPSGQIIRVISPDYFIATKFEAFAGRGNGDYFSHDLEDIVFVMENRARLIIELSESALALKQYFSIQAEMLLNDDFLNVLPGLLNNPDSARAIENSLNIMKSWK